MSKKIAPAAILLFPVMALAAGPTFYSLVVAIRDKVINPLVGILLTLALLAFFWGMIKYIKSLGEKDKKDGKELMLWGIIALFVMVSVWGLVGLISRTLGLGATDAPSPIILPGTSSERAADPNNAGSWSIFD